MGSFGDSPIGSGTWGEQLWMTVPGVYRNRDEDNGGYLKKLIDAVSDTLWRCHEYGGALPLMRDAMKVEGGFNRLMIEISSIDIVSAEESEEHRGYMYLYTGSNEDLINVSIGDRVYGAMSCNVRSVNAVGGYITVYGTEDPRLNGAIEITAPSLLEYLGRDIGEEIDSHEPETYQRNLVQRACYWQGLRGTRQGIVVRSKMSGFEAVVRRLFRISEWFYRSLPAENVFEIPAGSNKFYTDIEPRFMLFDEVRADVAACDDLPPTAYSEDIEVVAINSFNSTTTLSLSAPVIGMLSADNGTWYVEREGRQYYIDSINEDLDEITVTSNIDTPEMGEYTLVHDARNTPMMSWRPSHVVRIELTIIDSSLLSDSIFLEDVLTRLIDKLKRAAPAHVVFAQIAFILRASTVLRIQKSITGYVRQFGHYDEIAADEQPADTYEESEL